MFILITEAKYIALSHGIREIVLVKRFINELELVIAKTYILHSNNKMSIAFTKNIKSQQCTKYITMQYHSIKKLIKKEEFGNVVAT